MLTEFQKGFFTALLFTETDPSNDDIPLNNNFTTADIDEKDLEKYCLECDKFEHAVYELIQNNLHKAGANFLFTRNHHGVGFWDGDWDEGPTLTEEAHKYPEITTFLDKRKINIV